MKSYYPFSTSDTPDIAQVGGKGLSLIRMTKAGFKVPPGFVLTTGFFKHWIEQIKRTPEWIHVTNFPVDNLKAKCDDLKTRALSLDFDDGQRNAFGEAIRQLKGNTENPLFAVRSSSPEEDLEGASFAGGYETSLGVNQDGLEAAIKRSFASCFDERVILYKRKQGFAVDETQIAVIVQQLIPGEISGVAFSLNPINNCYDEAVINANYGLGESVVSGQVSPDLFVVDKISGRILEIKIGKKETSIWANPSGGTCEAPARDQDRACLSKDQVIALADLTTKTEALYGKPVDIEWTIVGDESYLLQARPVTTYIPLPEDMLTKPGKPRTLYLDLTMYKQGINKPFSIMGLDLWEQIQIALAGTKAMFGDRDGLLLNIGGRSYSNMSYGLKLRSKGASAKTIRAQDALSAEIIANVDDSYKAKKIPGRVKRALFEIATQRIGTVFAAISVFNNHERHHQIYLAEIEKLEGDLLDIATRSKSLQVLADELLNRLINDFLAKVSLPISFAAEFARSRIKKIFNDDPSEIKDKIRFLERALPNNVTIEMGLAMYHLSTFDDIKSCTSADEFVRGVNQRTYSKEFLSAWEKFMGEYGMRCPFELDIATPRFSETLHEVFIQLRTMAMNTDVGTNPQAIYNKGVADRQDAYTFLLEIAQNKGSRTAKKFQKYYDILVTLGGYRELHKYYIVVTLDLFRKRVLTEARKLYSEERLEHPEDVFGLTIKELDDGIKNPGVDLLKIVSTNTQFLKKIQHVRSFPLVIDSRGLILRPPRKDAKDGEIVGEPISVGVVRGRVKVLNAPDEKPVLPGEILVARATDPGWTPLFINAAGVILEIGGALQHGALVAREYGKPCVAGIENVTQIFEDGQIVELDGSLGVIRLL
jgi:pyruvate,water dikinase